MPLLHRLRDLGLDEASEGLRADRPDDLVGDHAVALHDKGLRNAINPPVDAGAAVAVEADLGVGFARGAEKAADVLRRLLLRDADELDALSLQRGIVHERKQEFVLDVAGLAPGRENVHYRDVALAEIGIR